MRIVRAWECIKIGHPGMLVYSQEIAIDKMSEGFDVQVVRITRYDDGRSPLIERECV